MVIDLRKQVGKRVIKIYFENDRYLDEYIDRILRDIEIVVKQRSYSGTTKIKIEVK